MEPLLIGSANIIVLIYLLRAHYAKPKKDALETDTLVTHTLSEIKKAVLK
ncbi:MAG: hypothetical protein U9Q92_03250 [archaeon]|nr:hypothetical protein [archaeon]